MVMCNKQHLSNIYSWIHGKLKQKLNWSIINFIKKEALTQVFSCEFCKISKNAFFYRTPLVAASEKRCL